MTDKQMIEELEAEESMFVQTARGMSSDGTTDTERRHTIDALLLRSAKTGRWTHGHCGVRRPVG